MKSIMSLLTELNLNYNKPNSEKGYIDILPIDVKSKIDSKEEFILLDVRNLEEHKQRHIPNSKLIPVDKIEATVGDILEDQEAEIIVYCRSGMRSSAAARTLVKLGYTNVYNLGGINSWPYDTEGVS